MPSERAAALADEFAAANDAAIALAESCSESQWRTVVPGEEWTVGVVLHHVAEGHAQGARWLRSMAAGDGVADTGDDIDRHNVTHAEQWSDVSVADTVALLRDNGTADRSTPAGVDRRGIGPDRPVRTGRGSAVSGGATGGGGVRPSPGSPGPRPGGTGCVWSKERNERYERAEHLIGVQCGPHLVGRFGNDWAGRRADGYPVHHTGEGSRRGVAARDWKSAVVADA